MTVRVAVIGSQPKRLLRIEASHFVAGATWELGPCGWRCMPDETAPILRWMGSKSAAQVAEWLQKKGYAYSWGNQFFS